MTLSHLRNISYLKQQVSHIGEMPNTVAHCMETLEAKVIVPGGECKKVFSPKHTLVQDRVPALKDSFVCSKWEEIQV